MTKEEEFFEKAQAAERARLAEFEAEQQAKAEEERLKATERARAIEAENHRLNVLRQQVAAEKTKEEERLQAERRAKERKSMPLQWDRDSRDLRGSAENVSWFFIVSNVLALVCGILIAFNGNGIVGITIVVTAALGIAIGGLIKSAGACLAALVEQGNP